MATIALTRPVILPHHPSARDTPRHISSLPEPPSRLCVPGPACVLPDSASMMLNPMPASPVPACPVLMPSPRSQAYATTSSGPSSPGLDPSSASALDQAPLLPPSFVKSCSSASSAHPRTPQYSSPSFSSAGRMNCQSVHSLLYPPKAFRRTLSGGLAIYSLTADQVAAALDHIARQPLPEPDTVFPWLHGLHPHNSPQQTFLMAGDPASRAPPSCLRGITLVKADGDMFRARLKGAISLDEILKGRYFRNVDPQEGFSIRNFQIQAAKSAMTSDLVVYGENKDVVDSVAWALAYAQRDWRSTQHQLLSPLQHSSQLQSQDFAQLPPQSLSQTPSQDVPHDHPPYHHTIPTYNTFVCTSPFADFQNYHPDLVAVDDNGQSTGRILEMHLQERLEVHSTTHASEISHNVWMGPTLDLKLSADHDYDLLIECSDQVSPKPDALRQLANLQPGTSANDGAAEDPGPHRLDFPAYNRVLPSTWCHAGTDVILESCMWIYHLAHGTYPAPFAVPLDEPDDRPDDDVLGSTTQEIQGQVTTTTDPNPAPVLITNPEFAPGSAPTPAPVLSATRRPMKILLHCADGYTESTMLGVAYLSFSTGRPIADAWLHLHTIKRRNFFAFPTDVALLNSIADQLLIESPVCSPLLRTELAASAGQQPPDWLSALNGSFPSRILDYLYLGNIEHASNRALLRAIGIRQILSVGESPVWLEGEKEEWGLDDMLHVRGVRDNGIHSLTHKFEQCLQFIDRGRRNGTATLVHCHVGVSRSATICIAEVMRTLGLSFPRAYCFVRARRLNVIIQPNLRFAYELLKWEEVALGPGRCFKREMEWADITRAIAAMNRPFSRPTVKRAVVKGDSHASKPSPRWNTQWQL